MTTAKKADGRSQNASTKSSKTPAKGRFREAAAGISTLKAREAAVSSPKYDVAKGKPQTPYLKESENFLRNPTHGDAYPLTNEDLYHDAEMVKAVNSWAAFKRKHLKDGLVCPIK